MLGRLVPTTGLAGPTLFALLSQREALDAAIAKHKLARLDRKEERERERQL